MEEFCRLVDDKEELIRWAKMYRDLYENIGDEKFACVADTILKHTFKIGV